MEQKAWLAIFLAAALCCGCTPSKPDRRERREVLVETGAAVLADGTMLDLWHDGVFDPETEEFEEGDLDIYKMEDGTALLEVAPSYGPENVYVAGVKESFDDLSGTAQAAVRAYYEERGDLYDLQEELERTYGIYRDCMDAGEKFFPAMLGQDTVPTASNGKVMYFLTEVHYPIGNRISTSIYSGEAFDRETGKKIENMDLFRLPEKEVFRRILDKGEYNQNIRAEMEAAIKPGFLAFFPEHISINFPAGSLPSEKEGYSRGISVEYRDLEGVVYDWAVPDAE